MTGPCISPGDTAFQAAYDDLSSDKERLGFFHGVTSDNRSTSGKLGNIRYHTATMINVPTPPITTAGTVPNHVAVTPDSNSPSSFYAPTKSLFTALTRPRIASGVASWVRVARTYTLTMSDAPSTNSAAIESAKLCDNPETILANPKIQTPADIASPPPLPTPACP